MKRDRPQWPCNPVQVWRDMDLAPGQWTEISLDVPPSEAAGSLVVSTRGVAGETGVAWRRWRCVVDDQEMAIPLNFPAGSEACPPAELPPLRPNLERALVEYDWRLAGRHWHGPRAAHVCGSRCEVVGTR